MKVAFCTNISDEYYHSMGADKLVKSAKYFHPDIPFFVYGTKDVASHNIPPGLLIPFIIERLMGEFDMVVRFDGDSMLTGPIDEIINATDYDVIGVRNNNDFGKAGADNPIIQQGVSVDEYLNAGLIATTSKAFIKEWIDHNLRYAQMLPFVEQSVLNAIYKKYKTLIVDAIDSDVYYGVSGLYGNGTENETHWDSWKQIEVVNEELILGGKKVKVVHHAGGFKADKLCFYMFNDETRKRLITITS